ncbi:tetratricopeptide repeat protein [Edaphobacter aggregans]|uniref:tetratricopeptide repeat protein n=1 Tax=Edaphobacter aggregans TaxID=570835 RepID=UPI000550D961|nr:tetratricopeptide repeat protein [Edaphobacter aggregans]
MLRGKEVQAPVKDVMLMLEAGCVYRYAGRFREARDIFQGVRALLPTREVADLALAGVSVDERKLDEAEAHCRRALELNSSSAAAYAQLGEIQLLQNQRTNAIRSLQRSMEISQNGPTANLAKSLLKLASMMEPKP